MTDSSPESYIRHLEMIQAVISRLAHNSFLIKGWGITLTTALLGFSVSLEEPVIALVAVWTTMMLWFLDAYYLQKEKAYRALYREGRLGKLSNSKFLMNYADSSVEQTPIFRVAGTYTLSLFYGALIGSAILVALAIYIAC